MWYFCEINLQSLYLICEKAHSRAYKHTEDFPSNGCRCHIYKQMCHQQFCAIELCLMHNIRCKCLWKSCRDMLFILLLISMTS